MLLYFDYEVWGTVSDWVMILVTFVTAILLWRTLKSQKDVQAAQNVLTKIELARYHREVEPRFTLEKPDIEFVQKHGGIESKPATFVFKLNGNIANNVVVEISPRGQNKERWLFDQLIQPQGKVLPFDEVVIFWNYKEPNYAGYLILSVLLKLTFTDIEGNKYFQICTYTRHDHSEFVESISPDLIR